MSNAGILVEAEEFDSYGGWVMDSQFEIQMGSPYLLAHGLGRPVEDAKTVIAIPEAGAYDVWVRAKDWVPSHHPGRFTLSINGTTLDTELGANGQDWSWQLAATLDIPEGDATLVLHDLTGFDGRCDAIFLTREGAIPVDGAGPDARAWRKALRGLPAEPAPAGDYDVVVVGGGVAGCAAALSAARHGANVALVQDRPVLGGNASKEIGLSPRGEAGGLVKELSGRTPDGDLVARQILEAEPNVTLFVEHRAFEVATEGARIVSIDVREARGGVERRLRAPVFVDCTGTAILGLLAGAEILSGQEAREEFAEAYAPPARDEGMHHGNTLFFRTRMADHPVNFPDVPWAVEVAKDYANLSGQLQQPGIENGPGPSANPDSKVFQFNDSGSGDPDEPDVNPAMRQFPATHFWEYGQWLDLYTQGEHVRDYLLRALYGTFSNVKRLDPESFANLEFDWIAFVAAQGEFNRYKGDYILTENDIRRHVVFPDAVVQNDGAFCIHISHPRGEGRYDFRLKDWVWDVRDSKPYGIPFRCLYSTNISNLMMAGKHISVTRIAGTTTKFMGNGGQHGTAVGVAAALCVKYNTTPRGLYDDHLKELQELVGDITGRHHLHVPATAPEDAAVEPMTARKTAERHARDLADGNMAAVMGDFFGNALVRLMAGSSMPPNPTTKWEILSEEPAGDAVTIHVAYSNDTDSLELKTRWEQIAGEWKIVEAQKAESLLGHAGRRTAGHPRTAAGKQVTARETAERHAQDAVDGNFGRLMRDFAGDALSQVMATGVRQATTKWEILSEEADGDAVRFQVRYSNDTSAMIWP